MACCAADDAQQELNQVLPALAAAQKALNALNKNDIIEIKTFIKPPALVQLTMEGVCILLQVSSGQQYGQQKGTISALATDHC